MNKTTIEWTDLSWNPVEGCTKVSQGCKHCYAERIFERFNGNRPFSDVKERPERLKQPLLIKEPKKIFVNSMSDLFHEDVSFHYIRRVFMLMYSPGGKHHTYQVLTKRAERMVQFYEWLRDSDNVIYRYLVNNVFNIWQGVSVEDQSNTIRIDYLTNEVVPKSFIKFVSCEPALGPVDFTKWLSPCGYHCDHSDKGYHNWACSGLPETEDPVNHALFYTHKHRPNKSKIDWIIYGGESGPGARPMHPDWARSVRQQCADNNVPFFFKQWGEYSNAIPEHFDVIKARHVGTFKSPQLMYRLGKSKSGNLLDGKHHLEFPTPKHQPI